MYYSLAVLHVSRDIFAHHQEHLNNFTASGITHVCRCRLVEEREQGRKGVRKKGRKGVRKEGSKEGRE
jgi:hypothetical protein